MDKQQIIEKLNSEKTALEEDIKKLNKVPDFGDEPPSDSMDEESDESQEYGNQLAMAQELKERLADIDETLQKIEKGEYGVCEKCEKPIGEDLLEMDPTSKLCQECKKELM